MSKILLIEDNPEVRENTSEILSLANYQVLTAANGKEGVELAQKELPDLIICDIMMPELDGYGVLHILSKSPGTARIPFIFLTAKAEKGDMRKGMGLGADDYITKPFEETDLLNAIEVRLKKSAMRKEYESSTEGFNSFMEDARQVLSMQDLFKSNKIKTYKKKANIYSEGDMPNFVYYLKSGSVKTYKSHPDGKELIADLYKPNDFFGYEPLLDNTSYADSALALEDSEVLLIPRSDFMTVVNSRRDVFASFVSLLCRKVADKEARLLHLAYNSVRQRTAEALLKLSEIKDDSSPISVSRDDLAKMVGTAPESVIRVLSEFKDEGLIEIANTKISLVNKHKMEQVVRWNVSRG